MGVKLTGYISFVRVIPAKDASLSKATNSQMRWNSVPHNLPPRATYITGQPHFFKATKTSGALSCGTGWGTGTKHASRMTDRISTRTSASVPFFHAGTKTHPKHSKTFVPAPSTERRATLGEQEEGGERNATERNARPTSLDNPRKTSERAGPSLIVPQRFRQKLQRSTKFTTT